MHFHLVDNWEKNANIKKWKRKSNKTAGGTCWYFKRFFWSLNASFLHKNIFKIVSKLSTFVILLSIPLLEIWIYNNFLAIFRCFRPKTGNQPRAQSAYMTVSTKLFHSKVLDIILICCVNFIDERTKNFFRNEKLNECKQCWWVVNVRWM